MGTQGPEAVRQDWHLGTACAFESTGSLVNPDLFHLAGWPRTACCSSLVPPRVGHMRRVSEHEPPSLPFPSLQQVTSGV